MYDDIDSPTSALDGRHGDGQTSGLPLSAAPPRFGRLAMCVAAASALAIGVTGTVAYGVWFNHDQQAYAEAMASARQALANVPSSGAGSVTNADSAPAQQVSPTADATMAAQPDADPEAGGQLASWSGEVKRGQSGLTEPVTATADNQPADMPVSTPANLSMNTYANIPASTSTSPSAAAPVRRPSGAANPSGQQYTSWRASARDGRATSQDRRATSGNAKHKDNNLFARVGLFFRRVSYRQHDNTNRQDIYSHP